MDYFDVTNYDVTSFIEVKLCENYKVLEARCGLHYNTKSCIEQPIIIDVSSQHNYSSQTNIVHAMASLCINITQRLSNCSYSVKEPLSCWKQYGLQYYHVKP